MSDLPAGWATTDLGSLGKYQNGRAFSSRTWGTEGRPIIRIQNLTGSGSHFNHFDGEVEERHLVRTGDLLVSWAATLGVYVWHGEEAALNQHIFKVESAVNPRWHRYALESALDGLRASAHGSGMVHVTKRRFDAAPVWLPPLPEQDRIADELDRRMAHLDAAVRGLHRSLRLIASTRNAILNATASGTLLSQDSSGWPLVDTGDVCVVKGGIQKQPRRAPGDNPAPFLRVANVGRGSLDLAEIHEIELFGEELDSYRLEPGDLLVVEGNGSIGHIGRAAMWDGSIADCVHQNHLIRVRPGDDVLPEFLALVWNAPSSIAQLVRVASSTSGLHTLSTGKVKSVQLRLPTLTTQRALAEEAVRRLSLVEAAKSTVRVALARSEQLRRSALHQAMTGKLAPQNPTDEPAASLLERIRVENEITTPGGKARRNKKDLGA